MFDSSITREIHFFNPSCFVDKYFLSSRDQFSTFTVETVFFLTMREHIILFEDTKRHKFEDTKQHKSSRDLTLSCNIPLYSDFFPLCRQP